MANSIFGMNSYNSVFTSPYKSYEVNPLTNFMFGATASKIYAQTVSKKLQSNLSTYMTSLSRSAYDLKADAKTLASQGTASSFNQKNVTSTDNSAISGTAASTADMKSYTLNISKLATAQINNGKALNSADPAGFTTGVNAFKLKVGNIEKNITFTVNDTDTNKSSLEKMSKAINSVKAGVTASVATDTKSGTSFIRLTADKTGNENTFSLSDTLGNAVNAAGLDTVAAQAQNAEYTLDGKQYTSQSNTIQIDNDKVKLTLSKAEGKDVKITINPDTKKMQSDVKELISSYNQMVQLANSSTTDFKGAERLREELDSIMKSRSTSLLRVGISQNSDGTLAIDSKKLESELKNNPEGVKSLFSGYNGLADKLYSKATEISSSPVKYAKPQGIGSRLDYQTPFQYVQAQHLYGQNMYAGLVVDTLL